MIRVPLLRDPGRPWKPAIISHQPGNRSVRSEDVRYTVYRDGSKELDDHAHEPTEWHNLLPPARVRAHAGDWSRAADRSWPGQHRAYSKQPVGRPQGATLPVSPKPLRASVQ